MQGKNRVLVVDDDKLLLTVLSQDLISLGYEVLPARSGREAIRIARQSDPDIILLDIMMPEMDGYEVCAALKEEDKTRDIPVVMLTVLSDKMSRRKGFEVGAIEFLNKPIEMVELSLRLKNIIALKEHRNSLADREGGDGSAALESSFVSILCRMMIASLSKDKGLAAHMRRIARYTYLIARSAGIPEKDAKLMAHVSQLYDIGMTGLPGGVSEKETEMKTHAVTGGKILSGTDSNYLNTASRFAIYHHEQWDGTGYPYGMEGEDIPVEGRIMLLADRYDALRSGRRPYGAPCSHDQALKIIVEGGEHSDPAHFDPAILDLFIRNNGKFAEIFNKFPA